MSDRGRVIRWSRRLAAGPRNTAEGSLASGTSKEMEIKLTNVARASLGELLLDYEDFLRQRRGQLPQWEKNAPRALAIRRRYLWSDRSDGSDLSDSRTASAEVAANTCSARSIRPAPCCEVRSAASRRISSGTAACASG